MVVDLFFRYLEEVDKSNEIRRRDKAAAKLASNRGANNEVEVPIIWANLTAMTFSPALKCLAKVRCEQIYFNIMRSISKRYRLISSNL